jgi:NAD(P)-dependent dehydrogenase (short-subunit alcohol dehydrogenase family)
VPYILVDPTANKEKFMSQDNPPVWFITGCSTGFGREIAQQVLDRGWRAVVTARDPGQVRDIVAGPEGVALALGIKVLIVEPGPFRTNWAGLSIKQSKTRLPDYEQTAGKRRAETEARSGNQAGDPFRGAEAIIKAVEAKDTPLRLLLGRPALDLAYRKLENFDAWAETTLGADFPDAQLKKAV